MKMKPLKVWKADRQVRKAIVVNSYKEILEKGGEKLGIQCVKAVLETDGTEIDEDYMECLENNTVLLLLKQDETWEEKGESTKEKKRSIDSSKPFVEVEKKKQLTLNPDLSFGPAVKEIKKEPVEEKVMLDAMIYGKNKNSDSLTAYQKAVNDAAGHLAVVSPQLLTRRGELYEKAREAVKNEGYDYKKGYSRASSHSSSSETEVGTPKPKRAKLHADERQQEKQRLLTLLENVKGHIKIKEARVNKAKSVQDYKLCDQMSAEIRQLLKDKADYERQISSIERKEQKSVWYHSKNKKRTKDKDGSKPKESTNALAKMFKRGNGSGLSETSNTSCSGVPENTTVITINETATPEPPVAACSVERSDSIQSNQTLILNSSDVDEDF